MLSVRSKVDLPAPDSPSNTESEFATLKAHGSRAYASTPPDRLLPSLPTVSIAGGDRFGGI
jgi:hypothetical protein